MSDRTQGYDVNPPAGVGRTLGYEERPPSRAAGPAAFAATEAHGSHGSHAQAHGHLAAHQATAHDPFGATIAAPSAEGGAVSGAAGGASSPLSGTIAGTIAGTMARTTVLPRVEAQGDALVLVPEHRTRYREERVLGAGAMGEVVLARDEDIGRSIALKRILPEVSQPSVVARFVDEIQTIGRLEHPNIVPIHDVGVDERGQYFFVMKYVEGETVEHIIERLDAGDPAYLAKYTFEARIELMIGLLRALAFAHSHGVVHRDIKPANVMVGPLGEVVVMDWGIAKRLGARELPPVPGHLASPETSTSASAAEGAHDQGAANAATAATAIPVTRPQGATSGDGGELRRTRQGTLIGTPAYMSPEQARGDNDAIDARSDLYSAMALFYELVTLRHYLDGRDTLPAVLEGAQRGLDRFLYPNLFSHPHQPLPPAELLHLARHGLSADPRARFQSAGEIIDRLHEVLEGKVRVQCHATMTKRMFREMGRFVDRSPNLMFLVFVGTATLVLAALGVLVSSAL